MEKEKAAAVTESLLFTMGSAISTDDMAMVLEMEPEEVRQLMAELKERYDSGVRGIRIIELEDSYQMCTDPIGYEYINRLTHQPRNYSLTTVMLETLAIIAYRQPVTRTEIERIRGVNCAHAINRLLDYGLIMEAGRLQAPGRPILFATTEEFLRSFGVSSKANLPEVSQEQLDAFRQEAAQEARETIGV